MKGTPTKIKNYNIIIATVIRKRKSKVSYNYSRMGVFISYLKLLAGYMCRCNDINIQEIEYLVIKEQNPHWELKCTTCIAIEMMVDLYTTDKVDREKARSLLNYYIEVDKIKFSDCVCRLKALDFCMTCIRDNMIKDVANMKQQYIKLPKDWYKQKNLDLRSFIKE